MYATGTLTVRVYVSQAQIPIQGATVVVTGDNPAGKQDLLSVQVTDSSGLIHPITIQTPILGESTSPDGVNGELPYALCTIWAEHPGYAMLRVEGVQIFPGVETIQNMEMTPLSEGESSLEQRNTREENTVQDL